MSEDLTERPLDFLRRLSGAIRAARFYNPHHPVVSRNVAALAVVVERWLEESEEIAFGVIGTELLVDGIPMAASAWTTEISRRLEAAGVSRIVISRGVDADELAAFARVLGSSADELRGGDIEGRSVLPHISVGQIQAEQRREGRIEDMAGITRLYADAVSAARTVWDSAATERQPDMRAARLMVEQLAQVIVQNRSALYALTMLKEYDDYTFTHMVNVSILTMGQARSLGVDGASLREFGLAGLLHDIGKVRTPQEILKKPDKLDDREFEVMKRHPVDGAEILKRTVDLPLLAPIVAFEHHLRRDGSGYPLVSRPSLNLCTMLCSIADVFDAMRSQRSYQGAFPTDRIVAVLRQKDGSLFDQHLVRRFVQLLGIYPVGTLVRLNTGEVGIVLRAHAADPYRPQVRLLLDPAGNRLGRGYDMNLWETETGDEARASSIRGPVDAAEVGVNPLDEM